MPQVDDLSRSLVAFDQDATLIVVVEMSEASWLVAGMAPGVDRQPLKKLGPDADALLRLVERWRDEAVKAGKMIERIALAFEAGRDGFWLARWVQARGIEVHVIHSTSVAVSREHRRAKTDRLDTAMLRRVFLGWLRSERGHCGMVAIPTLEDEDARRPSRERESLVGERTRIINRMKAILAWLGVRGFWAYRTRVGRRSAFLADKHVFQVLGVDASGCVVVAKAIRRNKLLEFFASLPPCLVGLEASGSAHHWARELMALAHEARMMPPAYVKPYIRRQKNDASDAAAICEAVTRPSMRFVAVRSLENQAALMRHKGREMLVSQRTQLLNGLRGHLTEVGVIAAQGPRHARELAELIEACDEAIPFEVCEALALLVVQLRNLDDAIARLDRTIAKLALKDETARRLMSIPGFGPITASAMAATVQDTSSFAGPREFAAFLGLTPKQNSSGGKPKLGRISKMGNRNLRKLLVVGAHAVLFHRKPHTDPLRMWAKKLIEKKPFKLVAVALANKMARIAFAILRGTTVYREIPA